MMCRIDYDDDDNDCIDKVGIVDDDMDSHGSHDKDNSQTDCDAETVTCDDTVPVVGDMTDGLMSSSSKTSVTGIGD